MRSLTDPALLFRRLHTVQRITRHGTRVLVEDAVTAPSGTGPAPGRLPVQTPTVVSDAQGLPAHARTPNLDSAEAFADVSDQRRRGGIRRLPEAGDDVAALQSRWKTS